MGGVHFSIDGIDQVQSTFNGLTMDIALSVKKQINLGALRIQKDAVKSVKAVSPGESYTRKGKPMVRSVPGSAPNIMDGNLWKNIVVTTGTGIISKQYFALVRSRMKYSSWLENGTMKMKARPFMKPAFNKHKAKIMKRIVQAVNGTLPKTKKRKK